MIALRRAYTRRLPQEDNPFYRYERVPIPLEQLDSDLPSALAANEHDKASGDLQLPSTTAATQQDREEDVKMDPAALADASTPLDRKPAASAEPITSTSAEPSTGSPIASTSALDKPSEQEVKVEDSAADTKENGAGSAMDGEDGEQNEMALDYYEDRIEVEWSEVDLETKVRLLAASSLALWPPLLISLPSLAG